MAKHIDESGDGVLAWGQLEGRDLETHVPFFEMAAVAACVERHARGWAGAHVVFGIDSAPVVGALNASSSRDPMLMRLLRFVADRSIDFGFDVTACHVTRSRNLLADASTRSATIQDFRPYLAAEGYSAKACADTVGSFPRSSLLSSGPMSCLRLGQRRRWR